MRELPSAMIFVLSAILSWVVPETQFARAESAEECSSFLLPSYYEDPSRIQWRVDHRHLCPVTRQGGLSTCWASAGATLIKPLLVRAGLMREDQQLSLDYYSSVVMRSMAHYYKSQRGEIYGDEIGPFYTTEIYPLLMTAGLVFSEEFRFPRLALLSASGNPYYSDIRNSRRIQDEFIEELNEVKRKKNPAFFEAVLDHYLGNAGGVTPRPIPAEWVEAHRPQLLVTQSKSFERILNENITSTRPELVAPEQIEKRVRDSLDRGNPVLITVSRLEHFGRMRRRDFSPMTAGAEDFEYMGEHAVTLVGYGKDANGEFWYLLQNSAGRRWGIDGAMAVSGAFIRSEVEKFVLIP